MKWWPWILAGALVGIVAALTQGPKTATPPEPKQTERKPRKPRQSGTHDAPPPPPPPSAPEPKPEPKPEPQPRYAKSQRKATP